MFVLSLFFFLMPLMFLNSAFHLYTPLRVLNWGTSLASSSSLITFKKKTKWGQAVLRQPSQQSSPTTREVCTVFCQSKIIMLDWSHQNEENEPLVEVMLSMKLLCLAQKKGEDKSEDWKFVKETSGALLCPYSAPHLGKCEIKTPWEIHFFSTRGEHESLFLLVFWYSFPERWKVASWHSSRTLRLWASMMLFYSLLCEWILTQPV